MGSLLCAPSLSNPEMLLVCACVWAMRQGVVLAYWMKYSTLAMAAPFFVDMVRQQVSACPHRQHSAPPASAQRGPYLLSPMWPGVFLAPPQRHPCAGLGSQRLPVHRRRTRAPPAWLRLRRTPCPTSSSKTR